MPGPRRTASLLAIIVVALSVAAGSQAASSGPQARHQLGGAALPQAVIGEPFSYQLETDTPEPPPVFSVTAGQLPPRIALSEGGLLSGVPTDPGASTFTASASNGVDPDAEQEMTLEVVGSPLIELGPAESIAPTSADLTGSVNPRNLPADVWFEYWPVLDVFQIPVWTGTAQLPKGIGPAGVASLVSGLEPGTEYGYRLAADNELSPTAIRSEPRSLETALPPPSAGKTFNLAPVEGTTATRCEGEQDFSKLEKPEQVTIGCQIDTTRGTASLTASKGSGGETQSAHFWGGVFGVFQEVGDDKEAVATLAGSMRCEKKASSSAVRPRARKGKGGRKLWGSGSGSYKTVGSHGAATVRGTTWLVIDRCDGVSAFKVAKGTVKVRDFVRGTSIVLKAGQSYVTKRATPRLP